LFVLQTHFYSIGRLINYPSGALFSFAGPEVCQNRMELPEEPEIMRHRGAMVEYQTLYVAADRLNRGLVRAWLTASFPREIRKWKR
jgi:hypothetical protein